jgi:hypothetical protein
MICHTTMLYILFVNVVYQLDREWCPRSFSMATFVVTLLVRMIHGWAHKHKFLLVISMYGCRHWWWFFVLNLFRQHTRRCDWETFKGPEEFLDEDQRKWDKFHKRVVYDRKQQIRDKYLKEPMRWILATIKRELNLSDLSGDPALSYFSQP